MTNRRQFQLLRDHLDLIGWEVEVGNLTVEEACAAMRRAGASLDMAFRIIRWATCKKQSTPRSLRSVLCLSPSAQCSA